MKIDIIVPVFGNLEIVKQCLESLYPLPENWNLIVYDSKVSQIDGTKEYLVEQKKLKNFTLIDDGRILSHPDAMKVLFDNSKADWILHLDSDVELKNRDFYKWVEYIIRFEKNKVWGQVQMYGRTKFVTYNEFTMLHLPRVHAHILLFERKFVIDRNIDFDVLVVTGRLGWGKGRMAHTEQVLDHRSNITARINGDTAWQLYWESNLSGLFGSIPNNVWTMCDHKQAASRNWAEKNADEVKKLKQ